MSELQGSPALLTVMAGYFNGDQIPRSTCIWVEALQQISSQLILVFDNPRPPSIPQSWSDRCSVVFNAHGEYDFGSYKRGLEQAELNNQLEQSTHVLFCNDSVYGPLSDLATAIKPMLHRDDEAWGLTESHQLRPHLQSFFLLFGRSLLQDSRIRNVFHSVQQQPHRQAVIEHYELGLSRALLAAGIQLKALIPADIHRRSLAAKPCSTHGMATQQPEVGITRTEKKALQDELANEEGFSETCRVLAQRNPRLWQVVLEESDQWRLWSQHLSLAILWNEGSSEAIQTRLSVLQRHLRCRWTLLLPVDFKHWSQLQNQHAEAIDTGKLQLVQPSTESDNVLPSLLATQHHWVVLTSNALWTQPHRWTLIQRLLIREPQREVFSRGSSGRAPPLVDQAWRPSTECPESTPRAGVSIRRRLNRLIPQTLTALL